MALKLSPFPAQGLGNHDHGMMSTGDLTQALTKAEVAPFVRPLVGEGKAASLIQTGCAAVLE
jgi:hypothetical protein